MHTNNPIQKVAILMAMEAEAENVITSLGLGPAPVINDSDLPFVSYQGRYAEMDIALVVSGKDTRFNVDNIGPMASTLMAYSAIESFGPDILISAGTAGGFSSRGAEIGTVYLSDEKFIFHDRRVPLAGFDESAVGHYPALNIRNAAKALSLPLGIISTGSSLQKHEWDIATLEQYGVVAKEMEAAAIAWVAHLKSLPFVAVKSITNVLDGPGTSEKQFTQNLATASARLNDELQRLLAYMSGKTLSCLAGD